MMPAQTYSAAEKSLMSLTSVSSGSKAKISSILGGRGIKTRLIHLGLRIGSTLEVISNGSPGPLLISIGDMRMALGYGIARQILVEVFK